MAVIAIVLLLFEVILLFTGVAYFELNWMIISFFIIFIFDIIYLVGIKNLGNTYRIFRKWLNGEVIQNDEWNKVLVIDRKLLVVNFFLNIIILVVCIIGYLLMIIFNIPYPLSFDFTVHSINMVVLFNGMIIAPAYILLSRKLKK